MQNRPARIAAIHDLSGFGRCSLSVILPTLSVMGVQVCAVPTAILSTHTGGLGDFVMRDLTDYIQPTLNHYTSLEIEFECIYSGFLSGVEQIDRCLEFFAAYPKAFHVVDPVMGDHGKPYKTCTIEMRKRMAELVGIADIITPNLTEVCILLNQEPIYDALKTSEVKSMLVRLSKLGPRYVLITGVSLATGQLANVAYDSEKSAFWRVDCDFVPVSYPGTGDLFTSVLIGGMLTGDSLPIAMDRASKFVEQAIKTTHSYGTDPRHGVMIEKTLKWLMTDNILKGYKPL